MRSGFHLGVGICFVSVCHLACALTHWLRVVTPEKLRYSYPIEQARNFGTNFVSSVGSIFISFLAFCLIEGKIAFPCCLYNFFNPAAQESAGLAAGLSEIYSKKI